MWRKPIVPCSFDVTVGSSPILYNDTVILLCAMARKEDSRVVAFDKNNGGIRWEKGLPQMHFGHNTPVMIQVNNKPHPRQVVVGIDAVQFAGVDQAHGQVPRMGPILRLVEASVLAMKDRFLQCLFANVIVERSGRMV